MRASGDGRLVVLGVNDRADGKLILVFPNAADTSDRLHAGHALKLPRREHWDIVAQAPGTVDPGPRGRWGGFHLDRLDGSADDHRGSNGPAGAHR